MSKCSVCSVRKSSRAVCTLLRPKYCASAERGPSNIVIVARDTNTVVHRNMGTPEFGVEEALLYHVAPAGSKGSWCLAADVHRIDRGHGVVAVAQAVRQ